MSKKEGPDFLFLTLGCRPSHHLGCILFRSHFLMTVRFHKDVHSRREGALGALVEAAHHIGRHEALGSDSKSNRRPCKVSCQ